MTNSVDYEYWHDFLYRQGAVCSPAQLHGVLCAGVSTGDAQWYEAASDVLDLAEDEAAPALKTALEALYEITVESLKDGNYGLRLLLPDDALPLPTRCEALADWCQGYAYGFGHSGASMDARLGEQGHEALADIVKIGELDPQVDDSETGDGDYLQLLEFVRVAVLTVFEQVNPQSIKNIVRH